jgi:hypothetical protein
LGIRPEPADGYYELGGQEWVSEIWRSLPHGLPCGDLSWAQLVWAHERYSQDLNPLLLGPEP